MLCTVHLKMMYTCSVRTHVLDTSAGINYVSCVWIHLAYCTCIMCSFVHDVYGCAGSCGLCTLYSLDRPVCTCLWGQGDCEFIHHIHMCKPNEYVAGQPFLLCAYFCLLKYA